MDSCIHHWYLGASYKGIVHAKCRKCGIENYFDNNPVIKPGRFGSNRKAAPILTTAASKNPH